MEKAIKLCLQKAIDKFNRVDSATLLCPGKDKDEKEVTKGNPRWGAASERAITHRLAVYLESELCREQIITDKTSIVVDCEYNRHRQGQKIFEIPQELKKIVEDAKRNPKPVTDDEAYYFFSIAPDVIVHERGNDKNNLLVVEIKKTSNQENPRYDQLKLECFTDRYNGYKYLVGATVLAQDDIEPLKRKLHLSDWFPKQ